MAASMRIVMAFLFLLVVNAEAQMAMAPSQQALVPGLAPFASPPFNPTGATTFISYAALSANSAPCPSGTGRSYYSPGCTSQLSGTPYTRGCYQITRCARG